MKVKILKDTVGDKKCLKAGSVVELSDKDAKILISIKKAEPVIEVVEEVLEEEAPVPEETEEEKSEEVSEVKKEKHKKSKK